ncbi:hypothetical protein AbraIFM66951_005858 [Aspergillus brasiliensis]|nr:hypothetical protein AbraIFM66951_005858 [Aspergillus brasiliensis]
MSSIALDLPGVALVSGAGGGIGAAIAKAFARAGCHRIVITDINPEMLDATQAAIQEICSGQVLALSGDISEESFVDHLIQVASNTFGRLDYVVNCAGILGGDSRTTETPIATFDQITRVNYRSVWLCSRAAFAQMLQQEPLPQHPDQKGAVVNIASQLAPYCASKAAIINLTRADAIDYSRDSIRVNCVCPGVIATAMAMGSSDRAERFRPAIDIAPMKRMGTPDEVANAVLFLCSPLSSFVQGHALVVDGGYTIN